MANKNRLNPQPIFIDPTKLRIPEINLVSDQLSKLRRGHLSYVKSQKMFHKDYLSKKYDVIFTIPKNVDLSFYGMVRHDQPSDFEESAYDIKPLKPFSTASVRFNAKIVIQNKAAKSKETLDLSSKITKTAFTGHIFYHRLKGTGKHEIFFEQQIPHEEKFFEEINFLLRNSVKHLETEAELESALETRKNDLKEKYKDYFGKTVKTKIAEYNVQKDFLVAAIGDSFMAGEGNPMSCGRKRSTGGGTWSKIKDKIVSFAEDTYDQFSGGLSDLYNGVTDADWKQYLNGMYTLYGSMVFPGVELITGDCPSLITHGLRMTSPNFITNPVWIENGSEGSLRVSRSYINGTFQAAWKIESKYPGIGISYINYATSGAEMATLHQRAQHNWQRGSQIDEIAFNLSGTNRKIDALFIGGGINDAGFSSLITDLIAREYSNIKDLLWFNPIIQLILALMSKDPQTIKNKALIEIEKLDQKYNLLKTNIDSKLQVSKVFLMEYPNALFTAFKDRTSEVIFSAECGALSPVDGVLQISNSDAKILHEIGEHLNNKLKSIANRLGWVYVSGITEKFMGHGYCSNDSYYRHFEHSCKCQGNYQGFLHVNEKGYQVISDVLVKHLEANFDFNKLSKPITIVGGGGNTN